jgi:hypothetical protein
MKRVSRFELWLPLCLLMVLAGNSAAQAPQTEKPPDRPKVKLPALLSAKPLKDDPKDDELRKLLKARYNEALAEARDFYEFEDLANHNAIEWYPTANDRYRMLQRVVQAGLDVCETPARKVALLTQFLEVTRGLEDRTQERYKFGRCRLGDVKRARYERLDAQIRLLRAKREADKAKDK